VQLDQGTCRRCGRALVAPPLQRPRPASGPSPLRDVWLSPRSAIRSLVERAPTRGLLLLPWLTGFGAFLASIVPRTDDRFPLHFAVPMCVVVGPLLAYGIVFVSGFLTTWTGRMLGGQGQHHELRLALAWSQAPLLPSLVLWIPGALPGALLSESVNLALLLWSEALAVVLVAEVHAITVMRSLVAILLAWALKLALVVAAVIYFASMLPAKTPQGSPSPSPPAVAAEP
jgi:hypothetical protein